MENTNSKTLTVAEAIAQGYTRYGRANLDYQHLHDIDDITEDDFTEELRLTEKESFYTPSISAEDLAELVAEHIECQNDDMTGDDTNEVYNIIKKLDFEPISKVINKALEDKKFWRLTDIKLIP
jgi:hypothetical protein